MSTVLAEAPKAREAMSEPEISILIYVTDPDAQIHVLVRSYAHVLEQLGRTGEMVFIVDGLGPTMIERLERLQAERDDVRVLTLQGGDHGESIAFRAALEHARGSLILTAWDYLQIDPASLGDMLERLEAEKLDLVSPWRHPRVDARLNQWQSSFFNWSLRLLSKVGLHDLNCYFRLMRREVLEEIEVYGDLFRFLPIMAARRGFKVREVKVVHKEERGKTGFFGVGVYFRRLLDILAVTFLTRFTRKPLRFFGIIGLILVTIGLCTALPPVFSKIFEQQAIQTRPIVLLGVVLISFGLQFIGFGLVGEIIIFTQSRELKDYKIDRVLTQDALRAEAALEPGTAAAGSSAAVPAAQAASARVGDAIRVRRASPGEDELLDRWIAEHPRGTPFHLSAWRRTVEQTLKTNADCLIAERGDEVLGYLPWVAVKSFFLGKVSVSMPFAVYGGVLAEDPEVARQLIEAAVETTRERQHKYLELRQHDVWSDAAGAGDDAGGAKHASGLDMELSVSDRYVTYVRELPTDPEECLGMIPRKARAEVRKGIKAGLQLVESSNLARFHRLFSENKQKLGSPAIPLPMLKVLFANFRERIVLHEVRTESGKTVAAVVSLLFGDRIYPYYSGLRESSGISGVNNFMYWKLMCWASERGMRYFDFGRSRKGSGPAHFKKNMGFPETQLQYLYWLAPGHKMPDFTPDNPRLSKYKRMWQKMPSGVARRVGAALFKQIP